jgi:hypothetical protein
VLVSNLTKPSPPTVSRGLGLSQVLNRILEHSQTRDNRLVCSNPVVVVEDKLAHVNVIRNVGVVSSQLESHVLCLSSRLRVPNPALQLAISQIGAREHLTAQGVQGTHPKIPSEITTNKRGRPLGHILMKENTSQGLVLHVTVRIRRVNVIPRPGEPLESRISETRIHAFTQIIPHQQTKIKHHVGAALNSGAGNGNVELSLFLLNSHVHGLRRSPPRSETRSRTVSPGSRSKNINTREQSTRDTRAMTGGNADLLHPELRQIPERSGGIVASLHQDLGILLRLRTRERAHENGIQMGRKDVRGRNIAGRKEQRGDRGRWARRFHCANSNTAERSPITEQP